MVQQANDYLLRLSSKVKRLLMQIYYAQVVQIYFTVELFYIHSVVVQYML